MGNDQLTLNTRRLTLRHWRDEDAAQLYIYARDSRVADPCGWLAHTDESYSRAVIRTVLNSENTFAITIRNSRDLPIGSIGVRIGANPANGVLDGEGEIGYWLGVPFWNNGYATEALQGMIDYCFREKGLTRVLCTWHDGNTRSAHVMEKCGMTYHHTDDEHYNPMLHRSYRVHFMDLYREEWERISGRNSATSLCPG